MDMKSAVKLLSSLLVLSLLLVGCAPRPITLDPKNSPCNDALFQQLKKKQLNELTEREYKYLQEKDRACDQWQQQQATLNGTQKAYSATSANTYTWIVIISLIGLVTSAVLIANAGK
jgi:hypothetical protein